MKLVLSKSGIPIRLTEERWGHITGRHPEMDGQEDKVLDTLANPDYIQEGDEEAKIAIRHFDQTPLSAKDCAVVYKEADPSDGFVLTAYFTEKPNGTRRILWKR